MENLKFSCILRAGNILYVFVRFPEFSNNVYCGFSEMDSLMLIPNFLLVFLTRKAC